MNYLKNIFWNHDEKRLRAFFRILFLLILVSLFANLVSLLVKDLSDLMENSVLNFLFMAAILLSIFITGKYIDKRNWSNFGITLLPIKQFILGATVGSSAVIFIFFIQYVLGWLTLEEIYFNEFPSVVFVLVLFGQIFRYVCGSVFEEAFSRGYLLLNIAEGIKGKINTTQAVIISYILTSSIFGMLHLANENASLLSSLNLILLGFLFGWMVIKTGKIHFAIGLHSFWNIFQNNVFGFANSGKKSLVSIFSFRNSGNSLWTGGEFGIEGGLLCTMTLLFLLLTLSYFEIFSKSQKRSFFENYGLQTK